MSKYIYYNNSLRCKISKTDFIGQVEIQPQKRFFIFWFNCYKWMTYCEIETSNDDRICTNPVTISYQFGNKGEHWGRGTMTLEKRCKMLIEECLNEIASKEKWDEQFKSI